MTNHVKNTLVNVVKRSLASLRLAVEDMRIEPTKNNVARVVEESETLSAAVAQLARRVDLASIDPPKPRENGPEGPDLLDFADRVIAAVENGICPRCGGACMGASAPQNKSLEERRA